MNRPPSLPEDRREEFRAAVSSQKYKMREIAAMFGITKNAAVGYAARMNVNNGGRKIRKRNVDATTEEQRLGFAERISVMRMAKSRVVAKKEKKQEKQPPKPAVQPEEVRWENHVSPHAACWECFEPTYMCHWPVRDQPFQFCGAPKSKSEIYCSNHMSKSTKKRGDQT